MKKRIAIAAAAAFVFAAFFLAGRIAGADPMPMWGEALWAVIFIACAAFIGALLLAMVGCISTWSDNPATRFRKKSH